MKYACLNCFRNWQPTHDNWFFQHIPAFCDGAEQNLVNFENDEELLAFLNHIPNVDETLCCDPDGNIIMTITKDGLKWWVHGYVKDVKHLGLPIWTELAKR